MHITLMHTRIIINRLSIPYQCHSGSIDSSIGRLSALTYLNLNTNFLTGEYIIIYFDDICSAIISSFCRLHVFLRRTGSIPTSIFSLSDLSYLNLNHNMLTGAIYLLWKCEYANMTSFFILTHLIDILKDLFRPQLSDYLRCRIWIWIPIVCQVKCNGSEIRRSIFAKYSYYLNISYQHHKGSIPSSISSLSALTLLNLHTNKLTGKLILRESCWNMTLTHISFVILIYHVNILRIDKVC